MGRRLAFLAAAGGAWLLLGAAAVLADGGPHVASVNNGLTTLTADSCAGCHRAHTAQGQYLLKAADTEALCLSCHNGMGATSDVVDGIQFVPATWTATPATDAVLGALRGGGFTYALIDAANPARITATRLSRVMAKVPVLPKTERQPVTSTHHGTGTAWGNGPDGTPDAGARPVELDCAACHNPHGNGFYRVLNPLAGESFGGAGGFLLGGQAVEIADVPNPSNATRNYTVLPGDFATDVAGVYPATAGDYWRKRLVWNDNSSGQDPMELGWDGASPTNAAANGGTPPPTSSGLMTAWCIRCHTRYSGLVNANGESSSRAPQPDSIFTYRHLTMIYGCLQCHVSHGSNALMDGPNALIFPWPDETVPAPIPNAGPAASPVTSGDSRLLKVGGRGVCQLCHDPTLTLPAGTYTGPVPSPGAP